MLHDNLSVRDNGHLFLNDVDTTELAKKYGTPLYVLDEDRIRKNMRTYLQSMKESFDDRSRPLFASKALSLLELYRICASEGMCVDAVSPGEVFIALKADIAPENIYFHGNAKTEADIRFAIENKIGFFICDNETELKRIQAVAKEKNLQQKILLRLTPGIDAHTFAAVTTGKVDSKFGSAIETGQAEEIFKLAISLENIDLKGFHCHIGSQIFDSKPFCDAADTMMSFMISLRKKYGYTASVLNLGGGIGVRYTEKDPYIDIATTLAEVGAHLHDFCDQEDFPFPEVLMEPGRSIVADAGLTLYSVQNIKKIPGFLQYAAVDGGMPDNPRFALYESEYSFLLANRASEENEENYVIAGRCCESGDLLGKNVPLPKVQTGDILATLVTGAYNYSMASNYNCIPRLPLVMVKDGKDRLAIKRESYEDLIKNQL